MSGSSLGMKIGDFPKLADFEAFVTGANKPYDNTVVRLSLNGGAEHKLCTTHRDFVGNFLRRQKTQNLNNDVRFAFSVAVDDFFGGTQNVPASVKLAMKLEDYGTGNTLSGKPLTARRIRATLAAISLTPRGLARDTGLSLDVVSNPVVSKRLADHPELKAKIKGLLDSLPDDKSRETVKTYIEFVISNPKSLMPLPFGKQVINDDPQINKEFEDSLNGLFERCVQDKDKPQSPYSPTGLLKQATRDILGGGGITTGGGKTTVWSQPLSQTHDPAIKSMDDKVGAKKLLMENVFKDSEVDTMDSLVLFNQGVERFSISSLPFIMGLGKDDGSAVLGLNRNKTIWKNCDITPNKGGYHVTFNIPYKPGYVKILRPEKSDYDTIPLSSESSLHFKAEFDLYRDKSGNFRVRNMHSKVASDLRVPKDASEWPKEKSWGVFRARDDI